MTQRINILSDWSWTSIGNVMCNCSVTYVTLMFVSIENITHIKLTVKVF